MTDKQLLAVVPIETDHLRGTFMFYTDGTYTWSGWPEGETAMWMIQDGKLFVRHNSVFPNEWLDCHNVANDHLYTLNSLILQAIFEAIELEESIQNMLSPSDGT